MTEVPRAFCADAIHLVRTSQQMGLTLSQMADQKASILMGATFVVFTISVNQAVHSPVSPALVILALSAFVSAMLAVFAIMPSVGGGGGPSGSTPNILFFGYYSSLNEEAFIDARELVGHGRKTSMIYRDYLRTFRINTPQELR